jgi:AcrR family transcriptional regulator
MKRRRIQSRQKKSGSWQRDPEGMRMRIMRAATAEFARYGFGGARLDRIAKTAGANKRMIYYHVGDKEGLYLAVLEGAYDPFAPPSAGSTSKNSAPGRQSSNF